MLTKSNLLNYQLLNNSKSFTQRDIMMFSKSLCVVTTAMVTLSSTFAQRPKILALHGGGGSPSVFQGELEDLEAALPEYEFVYAQGGYRVDDSIFNWIPDPPSKDNPTTSPNIADESLANLDRILEEEGPFFGILGFSQGAAFVPVYLANSPAGSFQKAMIFCGYLTETHLGLLDTVREQSPFGDISTLIWIGEQDNIIAPSFSRDLIPEFTSPTVISSFNGGHFVPGTFDSTFNQVVAFVREEEITPTPPNPVSPSMEKPSIEKPDIGKPDVFKPDVEKTDNDNDKDCKDNPDFFFRKKLKDCDWVSRRPRQRCHRKFKKKQLSAYCPKACGKCELQDDGKPESKPFDWGK